jgi:hypothetical protein
MLFGQPKFVRIKIIENFNTLSKLVKVSPKLIKKIKINSCDSTVEVKSEDPQTKYHKI